MTVSKSLLSVHIHPVYSGFESNLNLAISCQILALCCKAVPEEKVTHRSTQTSASPYGYFTCGNFHNTTFLNQLGWFVALGLYPECCMFRPHFYSMKGRKKVPWTWRQQKVSVYTYSELCWKVLRYDYIQPPGTRCVLGFSVEPGLLQQLHQKHMGKEGEGGEEDSRRKIF